MVGVFKSKAYDKYYKLVKGDNRFADYIIDKEGEIITRYLIQINSIVKVT